MSKLLVFGFAFALATSSWSVLGQTVPAPSSDLPRAVFITTMDNEFARRDGDRDGKLTKSELERFEAGVALVASQQRNRALFARLDVDRSGTISPTEFMAMAETSAPPDVTPQMTKLDLNRDQYVTIIEYRATTLANFDRLDIDHDGIVTATEMRADSRLPVPK